MLADSMIWIDLLFMFMSGACLFFGSLYEDRETYDKCMKDSIICITLFVIGLTITFALFVLKI